MTPSKCRNCKKGRVFGGVNPKEAKIVGTCGYCFGSAERQRRYLPKELYSIVEAN